MARKAAATSEIRAIIAENLKWLSWTGYKAAKAGQEGIGV